MKLWNEQIFSVSGSVQFVQKVCFIKGIVLEQDDTNDQLLLVFPNV